MDESVLLVLLLLMIMMHLYFMHFVIKTLSSGHSSLSDLIIKHLVGSLLHFPGYVFVSLVLFVLARFDPYEWDNPYPCIEEPDELENQFTLANSFWFTIGSLMQQGSDVAPISLSTRLIAGMWFFFALIMIASYTANLAAFLTVETLDKPIESADDLAAQGMTPNIKYGVVAGGSTLNFFKTSKMEPYATMWRYMSGPDRPEVMLKSNTEGIEKVIETDGKYAFMMESSSIQYIIERNCKVTQIGGNLDNKVSTITYISCCILVISFVFL